MSTAAIRSAAAGDIGGGADLAYVYGFPDEKPIIGDWNGDGTTTTGVYDLTPRAGG